MSTELDPRTFNVLDFIEGTVYPSKDVKIAINLNAAKRIAEGDESAETRKEFDDSVLTFTVRGLPPALRDSITKKAHAATTRPDRDAAPVEQLEYTFLLNDGIVARSITRITKADGTVDEASGKYDEQFAKTLRGKIGDSEFGRLLEAVVEVNFDADSVNAAIDAGFPGGRDEPATELRDDSSD